jgi:hypothetical protein
MGRGLSLLGWEEFLRGDIGNVRHGEMREDV